MLFVFLFLRIPSRSKDANTMKHKLQQLNAEGLIALIPGVICLCLALQWGGFTYSVSAERVSFSGALSVALAGMAGMADQV